MASATSTPISSISSNLIETKPGPSRPSSAASSSQCVSLPTLPPPSVHSQSSRTSKATAYCRKMVRNVAAMATSEAAPTEVAAAPTEVAAAPTEVAAAPTEFPDIVKTIQEAWDKVEDKYAITSLGAAGVVALCASSGMISAIDRLPLIPGVLELVGIGYTGWFAYRNLVFKPDREALIKKVKSTYSEIIGSS